ncbi:MAG: peptidoglycan DD-metalloendopeptidase family protein [Bacteroidales bacterium]|nr:peptidoglycan DD-metalloendopeptidase family protein [Bacteroidales bacterium]
MRFKFLFVFLLVVNVLDAQNKPKYPVYPNPVKIPIYLSATFGELRNNAFHAGVDIKTGGEIGKKVYAVADGYVSRIGVSPFGYGNVVYVTHNDGFMSVYAHLESFNDKIGKYVRKKQFESKSFAQNLFLEKGDIPVKVGDFLGLSGNSGGSGGPHLHYELRDANQRPMNPCLFGFKINDSQKPKINGIALYPKELSSVNGSDSEMFFEVVENNGKYTVKDGEIKVNGTVYFGISAYDQADGSANKNGVYSIELFADNRLIFNILFDKYSYDETRYINSLIDYKKFINDKIRYVRTEIDEYNILDLYGEKYGSITMKKGDRAEMKFVVKDHYNNTSMLKFTLIGDEPLTEYSDNQYSRSYYRVDGNDEVMVGLDGFTAEIPQKAFYKFEYVLARQLDTIENIASDFAYVFGSEDIPVQKNIVLKIRPCEKYASLDKLYMISVSKDGKFAPLGGKMTDGMVCSKTRSFGTFALAVDTIKPEVNPLNFNDNSKIVNTKRLRIKIKDSESGIDKYDIYLNGKWVVGAYDAKNDLLFYDVDEYLKKGKNKMEVVVTDAVGNETRKTYNLIREQSK